MKILILKSGADSFERYYINHLKKLDVDVQAIDSMIPEIYGNSIKRVQSFLHILLSGKLKKFLKPYDMVIVFSARVAIPMVNLCKKKNARLIYWQWNIVDNEYAKKINRLKNICEVWTFDQEDAQKYDWYLNNQFYCAKDGIAEQNLHKVPQSALFLGADKGRAQKLIDIYNKLQDYQIEARFYVLKDKSSGNIENVQQLIPITESMDYEEYLQLVSKTDLIVEAVQKQQAGLTLRTLEAAFYRKKLITDNKSILQEPLYNSENVFVLGVDSWDSFGEFLQKPFQPISSDILNEYTADTWVKRFVISKDSK